MGDIEDGCRVVTGDDPSLREAMIRKMLKLHEIRRKGQVRSAVTPGAGAYEGELTGIKKNVSHSTRF